MPKKNTEQDREKMLEWGKAIGLDAREAPTLEQMDMEGEAVMKLKKQLTSSLSASIIGAVMDGIPIVLVCAMVKSEMTTAVDAFYQHFDDETKTLTELLAAALGQVNKGNESNMTLLLQEAGKQLEKIKAKHAPK